LDGCSGISEKFQHNTYTWNARNQLSQISQGGNAQLTFSYDAMGRRISKTVQGTATQFPYDGNNTVQEAQGSTINPILVGLGIDERFARNDVTGRTYFLTDQKVLASTPKEPPPVLRENRMPSPLTCPHSQVVNRVAERLRRRGSAFAPPWRKRRMPRDCQRGAP
jgi:YD repeat-containing protein